MKTNALAQFKKARGSIKDRDRLLQWFEHMLDNLPSGEFLFEINPTDRTDAQNRFYWKCIGIIADHQGVTPEYLHGQLKQMWLPEEEYFVLIVPKRKTSTTALSIDEMSNLIDKVVKLAQDLNITLPDPEEWKHMR